MTARLAQLGPVAGDAARIAEAVGWLPGVVAVALGGSTGAGLGDAASDLDFHVYWEGPLAAPDERATGLAAIADRGSVRAGAGTTSWTLEDHLAVGGRPVELIFIRWADVPAEVEAAYGAGFAEEGFTTARLYSFAHGLVLHDPARLLGAVQARLLVSYPEATRRAILLRQPARLVLCVDQLRAGQRRGDLLYVEQTRVKIQLLWFDLLFALNRRYHPGEKRLLVHAARLPLRIADGRARWERAARLPADSPALADELAALVGAVCALVGEDGAG